MAHRLKWQLISIQLLDKLYMELRFEWDEDKNRGNQFKHGIWFEEVKNVFADPKSRLFLDPEHSDEEDRFVIIGMNSSWKLLAVVHCYRESDSVIRIISARRATKKEEFFYEKGI